MGYNNEDVYVLGLMARDAAMGKDASTNYSGVERDELSVFAAMVTDKENLNQQLPPKSNSTEDVAKHIFSRVGSLLHKPEVVSTIYKGKFPDKSGVQAFEDAFKVGYYTLTDRTVFSETQVALDRAIDRHIEKGNMDKAAALSNTAHEVTEAMMSAALPVICEGLEDGSIPSDLAMKTDEEIVDHLISSDGTKEMQIQHDFVPTMKEAYIKIADLSQTAGGAQLGLEE